MSPAETLHGHCLCGQVQVTISAADTSVGACHCSTCRRWGGGPLLALECHDGVQFQGEEHISVYASSDWAERGFCRHCGTHLFYRLTSAPLHELPAGLFDAQHLMTLAREIFIDEQPAFYAFANPTERLTGEQVFAMFNAGQQ